MTPQEVFETVANHLFTQGQQAKNDVGHCMYRGIGGTKCAVGILISDADYEYDMDMGFSSEDLVAEFQSCPSISLMKEHIQLLSALQVVHDEDSNWESTEDMQTQLILVAATFKLDASFITTLEFEDR